MIYILQTAMGSSNSILLFLKRTAKIICKGRILLNANPGSTQSRFFFCARYTAFEKVGYSISDGIKNHFTNNFLTAVPRVNIFWQWPVVRTEYLYLYVRPRLLGSRLRRTDRKFENTCPQCASRRKCTYIISRERHIIYLYTYHIHVFGS